MIIRNQVMRKHLQLQVYLCNHFLLITDSHESNPRKGREGSHRKPVHRGDGHTGGEVSGGAGQGTYYRTPNNIRASHVILRKSRQITAFSLNRMDVLQRQGLYPIPKDASEILGVEFAGHVTALGPDTSATWAIGDQVLGLASGVSQRTVQADQASKRIFFWFLGRLCRIYRCTGNADPPQAAATVLGGGREHSRGFHYRQVPAPPSQAGPVFRCSVLKLRTKSFSGSFPGWRYQTRGRCACPCGRFGSRDCRDPTRAFLRSVSSPHCPLYIMALTQPYHLRRTVTATASTTDKLDWLLSLPAGATHAANYKKENFVEITNAATGGKGVDLIIDMVGQAHFRRNLDALATDGRMTMLSLISGLPKFDTVWYGSETRT